MLKSQEETSSKLLVLRFTLLQAYWKTPHRVSGNGLPRDWRSYFGQALALLDHGENLLTIGERNSTRAPSAMLTVRVPRLGKVIWVTYQSVLVLCTQHFASFPSVTNLSLS